jgi:hypothetical protein
MLSNIVRKGTIRNNPSLLNPTIFDFTKETKKETKEKTKKETKKETMFTCQYFDIITSDPLMNADFLENQAYILLETVLKLDKKGEFIGNLPKMILSDSERNMVKKILKKGTTKKRLASNNKIKSNNKTKSKKSNGLKTFYKQKEFETIVTYIKVIYNIHFLLHYANALRAYATESKRSGTKKNNKGGSGKGTVIKNLYKHSTLYAFLKDKISGVSKGVDSLHSFDNYELFLESEESLNRMRDEFLTQYDRFSSSRWTWLWSRGNYNNLIPMKYPESVYEKELREFWIRERSHIQELKRLDRELSKLENDRRMRIEVQTETQNEENARKRENVENGWKYEDAPIKDVEDAPIEDMKLNAVEETIRMNEYKQQLENRRKLLLQEHKSKLLILQSELKLFDKMYDFYNLIISRELNGDREIDQLVELICKKVFEKLEKDIGILIKTRIQQNTLILVSEKEMVTSNKLESIEQFSNASVVNNPIIDEVTLENIRRTVTLEITQTFYTVIKPKVRHLTRNTLASLERDQFAVIQQHNTTFTESDEYKDLSIYKFALSAIGSHTRITGEKFGDYINSLLLNSSYIVDSIRNGIQTVCPISSSFLYNNQLTTSITLPADYLLAANSFHTYIEIYMIAFATPIILKKMGVNAGAIEKVVQLLQFLIIIGTIVIYFNGLTLSPPQYLSDPNLVIPPELANAKCFSMYASKCDEYLYWKLVNSWIPFLTDYLLLTPSYFITETIRKQGTIFIDMQLYGVTTLAAGSLYLNYNSATKRINHIWEELNEKLKALTLNDIVLKGLTDMVKNIKDEELNEENLEKLVENMKNSVDLKLQINGFTLNAQTARATASQAMTAEKALRLQSELLQMQGRMYQNAQTLKPNLLEQRGQEQREQLDENNLI